jgi:hypothetical protein
LRLAAFVALYVYGFVVLCIWQAARERKNWARWMLFIFFAVGLPLSFTPGLSWIVMPGEHAPFWRRPVTASCCSANFRDNV